MILEMLITTALTIGFLWFVLTVNKESLNFNVEYEETKMKDRRGKDLFVGDNILFTYFNDGELQGGTIDKIGKGRLYIKSKYGSSTYITEAAVPRRVIKL